MDSPHPTIDRDITSKLTEATRKWPAIELGKLPAGGAVIFPDGTGHLPTVQGRLNPVLNPHGRSCLYADNIAINGGLRQPVDFSFGEELRLADADGKEAWIRIVGMIGRTALVQHRV